MHVVMGPGISDTACFVGSRLGQPMVDETPVSVSEIQILELDQTFEPIADTQLIDDFQDMDNITYTSIIVEEADGLDEITIPRGLQFSAMGAIPMANHRKYVANLV